MTWGRLVGVVLVVLVAGCGVRPSGVITGIPAPSGPAEGAELYLLSAGDVTPVLRPTGQQLSPVETLTLLAAGPTPEERLEGLGSDVPANMGALAVTSSETEILVTLGGDVSGLSAAALEQITCTTVVAVFPDHSPPGQVSVTVTGGGQSREPQACVR
ncbi:hypothetical protein [Actinophytocola sp.]|uniref:hypothetical protein n=1 Tax=Actinophytocola sp. TaxID=1872138 RepID=UPI002ED30A6E